MAEQNKKQNGNSDSNTPPPEPVETRFKVNPVEILILLTMTVVVGNSAYNLLYGTDSFRPSEFKSVIAQSPLSPADGRAPASSPSSAFASLEIKCQKTSAKPVASENSDADDSFDQAAPQSNSQAVSTSGSNDLKTAASKVRLNGLLCGDEGVTGGQLVKATVLNNNNHFNATVFTDSNSPQFTTDYIPLAEGKNTLKIEFAYRDGKTNTQEISVSKASTLTQ